MVFIVLLGIIAFALASVSEALSIMGLADAFGSIYWSMIAMGVVLGLGKLGAVTFLYRHWHETSKLLSIPLTLCATILVFVTISGHLGFLSKGYTIDSLELKKVESMISSYEEEKARHVARKEAIDLQISQLPSDKVNSRVRLIDQFNAEQKDVTAKVNKLDEKISALKINQIESTSHVGTIAYIAKAFGLTLDEGVKWFILLIITAFEPLALGLTIAISTLLRLRKEQQAQIVAPMHVVIDVPVPAPVVEKKKKTRKIVKEEVNKDVPVVAPDTPNLENFIVQNIDQVSKEEQSPSVKVNIIDEVQSAPEPTDKSDMKVKVRNPFKS